TRSAPRLRDPIQNGLAARPRGRGERRRAMKRNRACGTRFAALFAILSLISACGSSTSVLPTAPTPAPAPSLLPTGEHWLLTVTFSSYTGPELCAEYATAENLERPTNLSMVLERTGESIRLVATDPEEPGYSAHYVGTIVADVLTASLTASG